MSDIADEYAQSVFENKDSTVRACIFCAGIHDRVAGLSDYQQPCPRVKSISWSEAGTPLSAEFWPNGDWEARVVFPSDVYPVEDDSD